MTPPRRDDDRLPPGQVVDALLATLDALLAHTARAAAHTEPFLTLAQHQVLTALVLCGPQPLPDLAAQLSVDPAVAARVCEQLERRRLTRCEREERIAVTDRGLQIVRHLTADVLRWLPEPAPGGARSTVVDVLQAVATGADQVRRVANAPDGNQPDPSNGSDPAR